MAGLLSASAFAPLDFRPGILLGPWVLFLVIERAGPRFITGFLYGLGRMAPLIWWLSAFHPLAAWGAVPLSACFYGLATRVARGPVSFAAAMTGAEFARSSGVFAFPWGVAGSTLHFSSVATFAPWIGLFGLSFLVYLLAGWTRLRPAVAVALAGGIVLVSAIPRPPLASNETITIGVVQGGFLPEKDYEFRAAEVMDVLLTRTRSLADRGADLVVWSETVILEYLNRSGRVRASIQRLADECEIMIVAGAPAHLAPDEKRNAAFLFAPGAGEAAPPRRYDKVHLVPFGEYLPGYGPDPGHVFLPQGVGDFSPAPIPLPLGRLGLLVCYEGAFPLLAATLADLDARILINLSNDAWARSHAEARQHADLMRLRVFETRRPFVRAGNVGASFIQAADGRVLVELDAYERGEIMATVSLPDSPPRPVGEWVGIMALLGLPFFLTIRGVEREDQVFHG
jgi:apolipoprotein N-acyltransferase